MFTRPYSQPGKTTPYWAGPQFFSNKINAINEFLSTFASAFAKNALRRWLTGSLEV
jgi:hypothetical protein